MSDYSIIIEVHENISETRHRVVSKSVFAECLTPTSARVMLEAIEEFKTIILKKALVSIIDAIRVISP